MSAARSPRISAYLLAGDPWWLENSVRSYYDRVTRIVMSYDVDWLSWAGSPLPGIDECLERIKRLDTAGKVVLAPGRFADPSRHPLESETRQRQVR